jgi:acetoin utilization deacetylase AcuC-like enzyme
MPTRDDDVLKVLVRSHPVCLGHRPGLGHPESPERLEAILDSLEFGDGDRPWTVERAAPLPPESTVVGALHWVHTPEHLDKVRRAAERAPGWVDSEDCRVSSGSYAAAVAAAGLALNAALDLVNGRLRRAFLAVRPPAHHAARDRAAGYCLFNHLALAAEVVVRSWSAPVLIADFDALHGDGTERLFWDRGDVGVVSVHRYPAFPGTGAASDLGEGKGRGLNVNVPLTAGAGDEVVIPAFARAVGAVAHELQPAVVILGAGFSAHERDPVGGLRVSTAGFRRLTDVAVEVAERWSGGRVLSFLEGGFDPRVLAVAVREHVEALAGSAGSDQESAGPVN